MDIKTRFIALDSTNPVNYLELVASRVKFLYGIWPKQKNL
jgi:hypothetical protein